MHQNYGENAKSKNLHVHSYVELYNGVRRVQKETDIAPYNAIYTIVFVQRQRIQLMEHLH